MFMTAVKPLGAFTVCPYIACRTAFTSVLPACVTACAHILKPMYVASMGSLVTRLSFLMKACHCLMKASLTGFFTDSK